MSYSRIFSATLTTIALSSGLWSGLATTSRAASPADSTTSAAAVAVPGESFEIAQFFPTIVTDSRTLTAIGAGRATAPADRAIVTMAYYFNPPPGYYDYPEDPNEPYIPPPPPQVKTSDLQPAVDALRAIGVSDQAMEVYLDPASGGSGLRLRVDLSNPSRDRVQEIITTANSAATKEGRFSVSTSSVGYTTSQCEAAENRARQQAMNDARRRAQSMAEIAGVDLGNIMSLADSSTWTNYYSPTCPSSSEENPFPDPYAMPYYDPAMPAEVTVSSQVTVMYELGDR